MVTTWKLKLYTYCALGQIDTYEARSAGSKNVRRLCGISSQLIERVDLDRPRGDGGSGFYTKPALAVEAFIARAEHTIDLLTHKAEDESVIREWREALDLARGVLEKK